MMDCNISVFIVAIFFSRYSITGDNSLSIVLAFPRYTSHFPSEPVSTSVSGKEQGGFYLPALFFLI